MGKNSDLFYHYICKCSVLKETFFNCHIHKNLNIDQTKELVLYELLYFIKKFRMWTNDIFGVVFGLHTLGVFRDFLVSLTFDTYI